MSQSELYTYDGLNRLGTFSRGTLNATGTAISGSTASQSWDLDALGNTQSSTTNGVTTTRTNDAQNQATTVGSATLNYDADGNTLVDQNSQQYVYDAWNRLVAVKNSSGVTIAAYQYDPSGRRTVETESGTTTDLYNSTSGQVLEERQAGVTTTQNVWGPFYQNQLIERDTNPNASVALSNGSVDTTFGSGGMVSVQQGTATLGNLGTTVVVDQGQTLVVTFTAASGSTPAQVAVTRYTSSGAVDSSFGTGGSVVTSVPGWEGLVLYGLAAVQTDGCFLLAVQTSFGGASVARFNADGTLDTSFGTDGLATLDPTGSTAGPTSAEEVQVRSDGVILVAGTNAADTAVVVGAFDADGSTDTSWGDGGATSLSVSGQTITYVITLLVRPNGEAIALCEQNGGEHSFAYLTAGGNADTNYGNGGVISLSEAGGYEPVIATLAPNGDIIAVGQAGSAGMTIERYSAVDGSLETGFGVHGRTSFAGIVAGALGIVTVEPDGKILVGAISRVNGGGLIEVIRLDADGLPDNTFGSAGVTYGARALYDPAGLFIDGNGRAMVLGYNNGTLFLQRFNTELGPERLYAEQDANYDVTSLSDASGNVVQRFVYSAYGVATAETPSGAATTDAYNWAYTFQGGRQDSVSGLIHFGAREYDPSLGRWMQQDPAGYIDGLNRYQDGLSNPSSSVDPTGLDTHDDHPSLRCGVKNGVKQPVIVARDQGPNKPLQYLVLQPGQTAANDLDWDQVFYNGNWYRVRPEAGALFDDYIGSGFPGYVPTQTIYNFDGQQHTKLSLLSQVYQPQFFMSTKATWYPGSKGETIPQSIMDAYAAAMAGSGCSNNNSVNRLKTLTPVAKTPAPPAPPPGPPGPGPSKGKSWWSSFMQYLDGTGIPD